MHRRDDEPHGLIDNLRWSARTIRPVTSTILHPLVVANVLHHHDHILSTDDVEEITDYIKRATDAECLSALSDLYLIAPLSDTYYRLFVYLTITVFTQMGLDLPSNIPSLVQSELNASEQYELESLRRGIRLAQKRTIPTGGH